MKIKFNLAGRDNEIIIKRKRSHGEFFDSKGLDNWYKTKLCSEIVAVVCKLEHFDFNSLKVTGSSHK